MALASLVITFKTGTTPNRLPILVEVPGLLRLYLTS
jgi:hypothetical protein